MQGSEENRAGEEWLTVQEVAALVDASPGAIYKAIFKNRLPAMTQNGRKLVKHSDALLYRARTHVGGEKPKGRPVGSRSLPNEAE